MTIIKKIYFFSILLLTITQLSITVSADVGSPIHRPQTITGIVTEIDRNSIKVQDEKDNLIKHFLYMGHMGETIETGDRVHVFLNEDGMVEDINKLTEIPYKKRGQNKGYIYKNETIPQNEKK
jgi:hypothetical protein